MTNVHMRFWHTHASTTSVVSPAGVCYLVAMALRLLSSATSAMLVSTLSTADNPAAPNIMSQSTEPMVTADTGMMAIADWAAVFRARTTVARIEVD